MTVIYGGRNVPLDISNDGRAAVNSKTASRMFYSSRDNGQAFCATSELTSIAAGNYAIYIKNNSQVNNIFIDSIHYSATNTVLWKLWSVIGTPVGGTLIVPRQLNLSSGRSADATTYGDTAITSGLTIQGRQLDIIRTPANDHAQENYHDSIILGPESAIAIEYDTGTTGTAEISLRFHFEEIVLDI